MSVSPYIKQTCQCCSGKGVTWKVNPDWMRSKRKEKGASLRKAALKIGVSAMFLCDVELGRRNPNKAVCQYFGIKEPK